MKIRSLVTASSIGPIFLLVAGRAAESAELKVLCANGIQTVMEDLAPKFERTTKHKLVIAYATGGATVKRVRDGEPADVVIAPQRGIDSLVKDGKAAADAVTALASTDHLSQSGGRWRKRHPFRQGARSPRDRQ